VRNLREYYRPKTGEEAFGLKQQMNGRGAYLGGGTDLMVHRPQDIEAVIDLRHADIGQCEVVDGAYVVGGGVSLRQAEEFLAPVAGGMLREAVRETAPWLIRNAATLAGNVANASPAADSVPALAVLDAELMLLGTEKESVPLLSILSGPHRTTLGNRLIHGIRIPVDAVGRRGVFTKLSRSKSDIAQVNVAVAANVSGDRLNNVRIALGAVAPTVIRATRAEAIMEGQRLDPETLKAAVDTTREEVRPITDWRASADYRRHVSGVLVRRALERLVASTEEAA